MAIRRRCAVLDGCSRLAHLRPKPLRAGANRRAAAAIPGEPFMKLASLFLLLCCAFAPGCKLVDIRTDESHSGVASDGFIRGYATYGWSDQASLLQIELLGGRSRGSILEIELWKLARVELGLLGVSAGIGPLHAGLGVFFYHPTPPFGGHTGKEQPFPPIPPVQPIPPVPPVQPVAPIAPIAPVPPLPPVPATPPVQATPLQLQ
jgi:hypothetical protein